MLSVRRPFSSPTRSMTLRRLAVHTYAQVSDQAPASVTFRLNYRTEFGDYLKIVGDGDALGSWDPQNAPAMVWSEGDEWKATVDLPAGGTYTFKAVLVNTNDPNRAVWEDGENRSIEVPVFESGKTFAVSCEWGNTGVSMMTVPGEELRNQGTATEGSDEGTVVGKMTMDKGGAIAEVLDGNLPGKMTSDEGETTTVGKMTVEGGQSEGTVGKMTVEGGEVGKMTIGKMTVDGSFVSENNTALEAPPSGNAAVAAAGLLVVLAVGAALTLMPTGIKAPMGMLPLPTTSYDAASVVTFFRDPQQY